jgi:hypothetical protein
MSTSNSIKLLTLVLALAAVGFFTDPAVAHQKKGQTQSTAAEPVTQNALNEDDARTLTKSMGEPVPGAEILVEQEPNDVPIKGTPHKYITDENGEFTFSFPKGVEDPSSGELILTITPPRRSAATNNKLSGMAAQKITVKFNTTKGMIDAYCTAVGGPYAHAHSNLNGSEIGGRKVPMLRFILIWNPPDPIKSNKGGFAVSGKNMS